MMHLITLVNLVPIVIIFWLSISKYWTVKWTLYVCVSASLNVCLCLNILSFNFSEDAQELVFTLSWLIFLILTL